jgi:hypothetical protein
MSGRDKQASLFYEGISYLSEKFDHGCLRPIFSNNTFNFFLSLWQQNIFFLSLTRHERKIPLLEKYWLSLGSTDLLSLVLIDIKQA